MEDNITPLPVDGTLDLHTFKPSDINTLVPDYLEACREKGIYNVRIIHGKGKGILRRSVHAILSREHGVKHFQTAGLDSGGWGATLVTLHKNEA